METTEIIFENVLAYNDSVKKQRMKDSCVSTWHKVELSERGKPQSRKCLHQILWQGIFLLEIDVRAIPGAVIPDST